jgi:hypothetical protein
LPSVIGSIVGLKPNILPLKLIGENVFQADFQFYKNRFQFIQSEMMLAMLDAKKRLVGDASLLGKLRVGKIAPFFSQERCQLSVKVALHIRKVAKTL